MDWRPFLVYITGVVDQELLLRHEYLSPGNRFLRQQIIGGGSGCNRLFYYRGVDLVWLSDLATALTSPNRLARGAHHR
jgi:hypothetical protein